MAEMKKKPLQRCRQSHQESTALCSGVPQRALCAEEHVYCPMSTLPLIIIAGPTGVGKTGMAIEIAELVQGEIVGADSVQIYRYMNIGTAKPTSEEQTRVPHFMIDIQNPDEEYSAADYVRDATAIIREIHQRGKIPLLVGGTGMYIEKVLYGIFEGPGRDETFRQEMQTLADQQGREAVYHRLQQIDPATATRLHPNDLVRVIRALEVFHLTGVPISVHQQQATTPVAHYDASFFVLTTERDALYQRINARVDQMMEEGFVEEVQSLHERGYHQDLRPLQSLGYKEIGEFLTGKADLESSVRLIKRNTRHYAKRQLTWFRKYKDVHWIKRDAPQALESILDHCLGLAAHSMQNHGSVRAHSG